MKTTIHVHLDKGLKEAAEEVAISMGLTLSILINALLIQVVHFRRVDLFAPEKITPTLRPKVAKRIEKAIAEAEAGKNVSPAFKTVEEVMAWLDKK